MRYYVTADIHGFFTELKTALTEQGFFDDKQPHKLIVCGDLFDRGGEAVHLQDFMLELLKKDEVILVRGNHEDLALDMLNNWHNSSYLQSHHRSNGTLGTFCQLTGTELRDLYCDAAQVRHRFLETPYIQTIIPAMVDHFETEHYIFTHGWIPCVPGDPYCGTPYAPIADWRNADKPAWARARWINGMEAAKNGITEQGKTIVCGHWHCSFGHCKYENDGGEFDNDPNFDPYYADGIIALDACTALSGKVNCIVIED